MQGLFAKHITDNLLVSVQPFPDDIGLDGSSGVVSHDARMTANDCPYDTILWYALVVVQHHCGARER